MSKKLFYTQPTADLHEVNSVGIVCGSPTEYYSGGGGSYGSGDTNDNGDY